MTNMKKSLKIILGIIILIAICWGAILFIDYNRVSNFKEPIIAVKKFDDGYNVEYVGLGYNVKCKKYNSKEFGTQLAKIDMYVFNKLVVGAIADLIPEENEENQESSSSFIGTVLEETTKYMIVEPNADENERKSSDKIQVNYGVDHNDYLYGIGRKVIIKYNGNILETYPAQIYSNDIETDGYSDFELIIKKANSNNKKRILNNKDVSNDERDFNLYYYGLEGIDIKVNNEILSLEQALREGKVTLDGIISKANKDVQDAKEKYSKLEEYQSSPKLFPFVIEANDGGSIEYKYKDYTIIKKHNLDGNRDVYIGIPEMNLDNIK